MLSCFHRHPWAEVIHQDPGKTGDVAEWCAEIVGNGIGKGLQFIVGGLQLLGTFGNPLFQLVVQLANFQFIPFSLSDISEGEHGATRHSVLVKQRGTGSLKPESPVESGVTQKYLGGTSLPA